MGVSVFYNHSKDTPGGAMWASPPTLGTSVFFVGGDVGIAPLLGTSVFSQICKLGRQKLPPLHEDLFLIGYFNTFTVSLTWVGLTFSALPLGVMSSRTV